MNEFCERDDWFTDLLLSEIWDDITVPIPKWIRQNPSSQDSITPHWLATSVICPWLTATLRFGDQRTRSSRSRWPSLQLADVIRVSTVAHKAWLTHRDASPLLLWPKTPITTRHIYTSCTFKKIINHSQTIPSIIDNTFFGTTHVRLI